MSDAPRTKAELLPRIETARTSLDNSLADLADDQLIAPGPKDGWSIKDHLAHLTAWEAGIAALLQRLPRCTAMGVDAETFLNGDEHELNAAIYRRNKDRSLEDVRAALTNTQRQLLDSLSALTDADLLKTYSHYQPNEPGEDSGAPIVGWIVGNTCDHYDEHRAWIEALTR